WVVIDRLNAATGQNFSSWEKFFGPFPDNGDLFSAVERYNLSSPIFGLADINGTSIYDHDATLNTT
ncbi:hypothetical protein MMC25_000243, partial [Agyrium rufum]|nr:hypothetical protein [Agyrium rufum]